MEKSIERQVAYKVRIRDVLEGTYQKGNQEFDPNYIITQVGLKLARVNLIGVVVAKEEAATLNINIDDGTGKINVRSFEQLPFPACSIGNIVTIIGKPRVFGTEKYILCESCKSIQDQRWVELRKLEWEKSFPKKSTEQKEVIEEEVKNEDEGTDRVTHILTIIRTLDKGSGADIEEVIKQTKQNEKIIQDLLEQGEIFEIRPGKIKVLE